MQRYAGLIEICNMSTARLSWATKDVLPVRFPIRAEVAGRRSPGSSPMRALLAECYGLANRPRVAPQDQNPMNVRIAFERRWQIAASVHG